MLPHFPALLLLLVSSGGSDLSPSHFLPWKDPSSSRPSRPQPPARRPERGHGVDTLTSSIPEIKVRNEVLSDVADHLLRPSGASRDASPASSAGAPHGAPAGQAGEGPLSVQHSEMVLQPAHRSPTTQVNILSIFGPPRLRGRPRPSGEGNVWVISAASRNGLLHANHRLSPKKPSLSTMPGCRTRDAYNNANHFISDTQGQGSQFKALMKASHQNAPPLPHHDINSPHNYVSSFATRNTTPLGKPLLDEIKASGPSRGGSEELGYSIMASTHPKVRRDGDSVDEMTLKTSRWRFNGGGTQYQRTGEDHTSQGYKSASSVRSLDAAQLKQEIREEGGGGGGGGGGGRGGGEGGGSIDFTPSFAPPVPPISRHTNIPLSSVLKKRDPHTPILLMSDNPEGALMAKNEPSSKISGGGGNSTVYAADAPLSEAWRRASAGLAAGAAVAGQSSNKKTKNSLFRVDRADREAGVRGGRPRTPRREKRGAEGAWKNEFVVVDVGATRGHWDMAAGQGQDRELV